MAYGNQDDKKRRGETDSGYVARQMRENPKLRDAKRQAMSPSRPGSASSGRGKSRGQTFLRETVEGPVELHNRKDNSDYVRDRVAENITYERGKRASASREKIGRPDINFSQGKGPVAANKGVVYKKWLAQNAKKKGK